MSFAERNRARRFAFGFFCLRSFLRFWFPITDKWTRPGGPQLLTVVCRRSNEDCARSASGRRRETERREACWRERVPVDRPRPPRRPSSLLAKSRPFLRCPPLEGEKVWGDMGRRTIAGIINESPIPSSINHQSATAVHRSCPFVGVRRVGTSCATAGCSYAQRFSA